MLRRLLLLRLLRLLRLLLLQQQGDVRRAVPPRRGALQLLEVGSAAPAPAHLQLARLLLLLLPPLLLLLLLLPPLLLLRTLRRAAAAGLALGLAARADQVLSCRLAGASVKQVDASLIVLHSGALGGRAASRARLRLHPCLLLGLRAPPAAPRQHLLRLLVVQQVQVSAGRALVNEMVHAPL